MECRYLFFNFVVFQCYMWILGMLKFLKKCLCVGVISGFLDDRNVNLYG